MRAGLRFVETVAVRAVAPAAAFVVAAVVLGVAALSPRMARGREYRVDVRVDNADDLRQLYYDGLLPEDEFEALLRLVESPIDLNRAERADVYQLPGISAAMADAIVKERVRNGPYALPAELLTRVPGFDWRLLQQVSPFVTTRLPDGARPFARGSMTFGLLKPFRATEAVLDDYPARSHSIQQIGYGRWPAFALQGGFELLGWFDMSLAGTAQEGISRLVFDPHARDFHAAWGTPTFRPYSGWARVKKRAGDVAGEVIAGSYHAAFGEGLVINTIGGRGRHGFAVTDSVERSDLRYRTWDGLVGGAARVVLPVARRLDIDLAVFGSVRDLDIYSGYVGLAAGRAIPPGADVETASPRVWVDQQRVSYLTLPNVIRVGLVGGNFTARINKRTHIGFTGWAGLQDRSIIPGVEDDLTLEIRRTWPVARNFGSLGIDAAIGAGLFDLSGEWALWMGDGAGQGLLLRAELAPAWGLFSLILRHYDVNFANPYSAAPADGFTIGGLRARGEDGIRFLADLHPDKRIGGRVQIDLARRLLFDVWDIDTDLTVRGRPLPWMELQTQIQWTNQNLALNGPGHLYGGSLTTDDYEALLLSEDFDDEAVPTAGERVAAAFALRFDDKKVGNINVRYGRDWRDAGKTRDHGGVCRAQKLAGHSLRVWGQATPGKTTTIGSGLRYMDSDVSGDRSGSSSSDLGDHGFEAYLALAQSVREKVTFRMRGALGRRLPDPPSACDAGDDVPADDVFYDPSPYDLRFFGEFTFSMTARF